MASSRQKWLDALRSFRRGSPLPADLSTLVDDPSPVIRLCVAGVRWAESGEALMAQGAAAVAIRSGDRDAVLYGCHLLTELGIVAGDIVPLVWGLLQHPDGVVRGNAAFALYKCCPDKQVLGKAAGLLQADTGNGLSDALIQYAAHKLRKSAESNPTPS